MTEIINKLKKNKMFPLIVIAISAGLLLVLLPSSEDTKNAGTVQNDDAREYIEYLESKAAKLICEVEGVKDCTVMINVTGGYRYSYASNQRVTQNGENRDSQKEYVTLDGDSMPLLTERRMPEILGVAVVCPGITPETEYKIMRLLSALFDVASNRISITK